MARPPAWTRQRRAAFLEALALRGNVTWAAHQAGISRSRLYKLRKTDPELAKEWDEALAESADLLEAEAVRRAVEGTEEPYFYQGEQRGAARKYSDQLLMFLLKERRGEATNKESPSAPVIFELHLGPPESENGPAATEAPPDTEDDAGA
ncbi:hypothetical protein SAMN02745704_01883 [Paucidesulfovibrio gracilis DSM 16080]|uniref:Homeodomain-like domain-containing protein n=1 Tax=Paucidesulfovibrio gracilis DSM 16080 TaxID=1121449 RepID=A0A1T4X9H3_9BACT|nr:hypothetical protein [Paucidesulfovibrio gracilis]SKA85541.1 hypothetical protein SAMN02745704_01883 [Paucidesulfovibrio gracilis DSM 16080]